MVSFATVRLHILQPTRGIANEFLFNAIRMEVFANVICC